MSDYGAHLRCQHSPYKMKSRFIYITANSKFCRVCENYLYLDTSNGNLTKICKTCGYKDNGIIQKSGWVEITPIPHRSTQG